VADGWVTHGKEHCESTHIQNTHKNTLHVRAKKFNGSAPHLWSALLTSSRRPTVPQAPILRFCTSCQLS
jgi:hypothetical protein